MNFLDIVQPNIAKKPTQVKSDLSNLQFIKTHSANIELWPAGEDAAQEKLASFLQLKLILIVNQEILQLLMELAESHPT